MAGTGIVWPADAVSGAPSYTGRMLRNTQAPFLAGATAGRPLGALSGVRPGTPSNTVVATSSVLYTVTPFAGIIDLETAAISGPYAFAFNANVTGAIAAAGGTPRQDAVYVQINDAAESDGTVGAPNIKIDYLAGTVNSGGTLVIAAVPARSFVIANINVPASGGGSPTVTWVAPYAVAAGAPLWVGAKAQLDAVAGTGSQHATVFADSTSTLNGDYVWNGVTWQRSAPYAQAAGFLAPGSQSSGNTTVNLPAGRFSVAPIVVASPSAVSTNISLLVNNITATSFQVQIFDTTTGAAKVGIGFNWQAIQMTPSVAAG